MCVCVHTRVLARSKAKTACSPHWPWSLAVTTSSPHPEVRSGCMEGRGRERKARDGKEHMFKNKHCLLLNGLESICKRDSGLWGFRGWLVWECFVCRVGVGGFHILPHCHIWGSHLCWADGSLSSPVLMARGAARSGPVMAIPGRPGEGSRAGPRQPVYFSPTPHYPLPFSPSLPR